MKNVWAMIRFDLKIYFKQYSATYYLVASLKNTWLLLKDLDNYSA